MYNVNLTVPEFKIPGIPGYSPTFGTKKSDGEPLTTKEVNDNMMLAYTGATKVIELDNDMEIETTLYENVVIKFTNHVKTYANIIFYSSFYGARIRLINNSRAYITCDLKINRPVKAATIMSLNPGHIYDMTYQPDGLVVTSTTLYGMNTAESEPGHYHVGRDLSRVFGGVTHQQVIEILHSKCSQYVPDYSGIKIGDYLEFPNNGLADGTLPIIRFVVAGFNTFSHTRFAPNHNKHHILWVSDSIIQERIINSLPYDQNYITSNLYNWLQSTATSKLRQLIGNPEFLYPIHRSNPPTFLPMGRSSTTFIPLAEEVFDNISLTGGSVQFPIFKETFHNRVKFFRRLTALWWLASPSGHAPATDYYCVSVVGEASAARVNTPQGVVLCFCTR